MSGAPLLGRVVACAVGVGVGSVASYVVLVDELKKSTSTILSAHASLAARVAALEKK